MFTPLRGFFAGLLLAVAVVLYRVFVLPWRRATWDLPRAKRTNWFWGNLKEIFDAEPSEQHLKWVSELGGTFVYEVFLGGQRLCTTDPKALTHILMSESYSYPKPDFVRRSLANLLGKGVLFAEGQDHKRQRKIMTPAFAPAHIRALTPVFLEKSRNLADVWRALLRETEGGEKEMNIMPFLSDLTLDIIGLAGFDYDFTALPDPAHPHATRTNVLSRAFADMFAASANPNIFQLISFAFPSLRAFPTRARRVQRESMGVMESVGLELIEKKKADASEAQEAGEKVRAGRSKDLISLLIRANMDPEIKESERMSDDEVLGQITTFMLAGHETTSTAATWTLYALVCKPHVQDKLRAELRAAEVDAEGNVGMDELNGLPYLDKVCKESLRLYSPVPNTIRHSSRADSIPLSKPIPSRTNRAPLQSIPVDANQAIFIPIALLTRSREIWGDDADEFRPERWDDEEVKEREGRGAGPSAGVGIWAGLLVFLAGPRSCIGYRFALVELKAILFTLIRSFEFVLPEDPPKVRKKGGIVMRPQVWGREKEGFRRVFRVLGVWRIANIC